MVLAAIPEILYKDWFWLPIAVGLTVIIYFARRKGPPPFPGVGKFFAKHKRAITRITDIFWICLVLFFLAFLLLLPLRILFESLSDPEPIRTMSLQFACSFLFLSLTVWSAFSGLAIGSLSVFQSNLTKTKRIVLLVVCLLPVTFTVLEVLTGIPETRWATVQLGLYLSAWSWIVNAPAIITGKPFSVVLSDIGRKIKSALCKSSS